MVKSHAPAPRHGKAQRATELRDESRRIGEMIDFATRAKQIADSLGERFLAYLLAMVIQEMSLIEDRREMSLAATTPQDPASSKPTTT